jgi:hypothetical protein
VPVRKYRSLEEAVKSVRLVPGSAEFSRALRAVFWIAGRFGPSRKAPPGVHKFRSIEEAQARKKGWAHIPIGKN